MSSELETETESVSQPQPEGATKKMPSKKTAKPKPTPAKKKGKGGKKSKPANKPKAEKAHRGRSPKLLPSFSDQVRDAIANAKEPIAHHELMALLGDSIPEAKAIKTAETNERARAKFSGKEREKAQTRQEQVEYGRGYLITHALGALRRAGEIKRSGGKDRASWRYEITKTGEKRRAKNMGEDASQSEAA